MARSKIDFKPFAAFLYPNARGHRSEIKFSLGLSAIMVLFGVKSYLGTTSSPVSNGVHNHSLITSYFQD